MKQLIHLFSKGKLLSFYLVILFFFSMILTDATAAGTWTQKTNFGGINRDGAVGFSLGTKGYVCCGEDGANHLKDLWEYDPAGNTWTQKANFGGAARQMATAFSIGTKGYVVGGTDINNSFIDMWEYDQASNSWTSKANIPMANNQLDHAIAFTVGTKAYVGTGYNTYGEFKIWDQGTNTWSSASNYCNGVTNVALANAFVIGTKGYLATGLHGGVYSDEVWEYNTANNTWTQKANYGGGATGGGYSFAIGNIGYVGDYFGFWSFDPVANVWTQETNLPGTARSNSADFCIGGAKGYVATGQGTGPVLLKDCWEFTPGGGATTATTGVINPATNCAGATVSVPFTITGTYNAGNVFTAELSNSLGSFAFPIAIGSLAGVNAGTISAVIPANTSPSGSGYKIRVVASSPSTIGSTSSVTINALPVVSISGASTSYCINNSPATFTGVPAGGTFSGNAMNGNVFDPLAAGLGVHTVTYSYTDANGCSGVATLNITVNPIPTVSITGLNNAYILADPAATMIGSPAGGFFSGPGVGGNKFNPAVANIGTHNIVYIYNDGNGCANAICQSVVVTQFIAVEENKKGDEMDISVFPNPSNGKFSLAFDPQQQVFSIKVTNVMGQIVYEENHQQFKGRYNKLINLESFSNGIYSLVVQVNGNTYQQNIIKGQ